MLSGDSGCGKTMIARSLLHELDPSRTEIALMSNPCRDGEDFLREILYRWEMTRPLTSTGSVPSIESTRSSMTLMLRAKRPLSLSMKRNCCWKRASSMRCGCY